MNFYLFCGILKDMKRIRFSLVIIVSLFLAAGVCLFAEPVSGTVSYIEGTVDVFRDGKLLDWELVDTGFTVEEYDLIETGDNGVIELAITMPSGTGAHITIQPDTSFHFELDKKSTVNRVNFTMLSGAMAYKVQKLAGNDALNVQTASAAMGVRGTEFQVVYSPEGGILVLCSEGKVAVSDKDGAGRYSEPGRVVEKVPEKEITAFAVDPADLSMYRSYWISARDKVFKAGADTFIKGFARQYLMLGPEFDKAYGALEAVKPLLEKYGGSAGSVSMGTLLQAKGQVSPAVVKMRSILPMYEMDYYRLKVLEKYHDQGLGHGMIRKNLTSGQFFLNFKEKKAFMERELAEVRYMFKLYGAIHNAAGGGPSILDEPFGGIPSSNIPKSNFPAQ